MRDCGSPVAVFRVKDMKKTMEHSLLYPQPVAVDEKNVDFYKKKKDTTLIPMFLLVCENWKQANIAGQSTNFKKKRPFLLAEK